MKVIALLKTYIITQAHKLLNAQHPSWDPPRLNITRLNTQRLDHIEIESILRLIVIDSGKIVETKAFDGLWRV